MADEETQKCDHVICTCRKTEDSDYCGVYCETAGNSTELVCDCGHPGCAAEL